MFKKIQNRIKLLNYADKNNWCTALMIKKQIQMYNSENNDQYDLYDHLKSYKNTIC